MYYIQNFDIIYSKNLIRISDDIYDFIFSKNGWNVKSDGTEKKHSRTNCFDFLSNFTP